MRMMHSLLWFLLLLPAAPSMIDVGGRRSYFYPIPLLLMLLLLLLLLLLLFIVVEYAVPFMSGRHTTHTHTHIYIYIYIYTTAVIVIIIVCVIVVIPTYSSLDSSSSSSFDKNLTFSSWIPIPIDYIYWTRGHIITSTYSI